MSKNTLLTLQELNNLSHAAHWFYLPSPLCHFIKSVSVVCFQSSEDVGIPVFFLLLRSSKVFKKKLLNYCTSEHRCDLLLRSWKDSAACDSDAPFCCHKVNELELRLLKFTINSWRERCRASFKLNCLISEHIQQQQMKLKPGTGDWKWKERRKHFFALFKEQFRVT